MNPTSSLGTACLLFATCAGAPPPTTDESAQLAQAERLLAQGDPDGALAITDRLLQEHADWPQAWSVAARGNRALSTIERRGLDRGLVLRDAEAAFVHVSELSPDDDDAWYGLAQVRYDLADYPGSREAADHAAQLRSVNKADAADLAACMLLSAQCDQREVIAMRQLEVQTGKPDHRGIVPVEQATLELAQRALQRFEAAKRHLPAASYRGAALVYQWIDQNDNALLELERGIHASPEVAEVHIAWQDLHVAMGQQRALSGAYTRLLRENPRLPILKWFQGRANVVIADDQRGKHAFQPAIDYYRQAAECYRGYAAGVPGHAESAGEWIAICELSIARTACDMGDTDSARTYLFAAADASPKATQYDGAEPALRDSFGSHFAGVVFAIGRALSTGSEGSLEQTLAFHEQVIERFPDRWGFVYNNAALPARDLGVKIAGDLEGKTEEQRRDALARAMALWEKSYRYYEAAVRLAPDDARIVNDCGLMLVYHLNRDFDRARELFQRAIDVGQPQLDALPASTPAEERQLLEEAVGDAWQNIAVLMARHLGRPLEEQRPFLEKALTYYPYRQREAARMLERRGEEASGGTPAPQGTDAEALARLKTEAEAKAKDDDLDGALAAIDAAQKQLKGFAPYHVLRGDFALRYARAARDQGKKGVDLLYADAAAFLAKAVELDGDPGAPRQLLAEAQYEQGEMTKAARTASALLLHLQSQGGGAPAAVAAAHRVRAAAAGRQYIADQGAPASKSLLDDARLSFRYLEQQQQLDAQALKTWSTLETWAKAPAEAVGIYARALVRSPDDQVLLAAVVDTALAAGEPARAVDALEKRSDAAGRWYLGRARFLAAADLRVAGKLDEALAELDRARTAFDQAKQQNRDFADSCEQWLAICLGKKGNIALSQKRWVDAEQWLLESVRLRPDRIGDDLGLQETTKIGVMLLADHFMQKEDLGKAEAIYRAATDAAHSDLDLLNNAGLFARDRGNQLERQGNAAEAKALYEQSYKAYSRSIELDANNVRLRNDRALIAIHYLARDWDENKELLLAAIRDGDVQLKEYPAGDDKGRQLLDEAVGDCWENLALWHLRKDRDGAAAKAAAQKSFEFHPGQRRPGARRHLEAAEALLQEKK